MWGLGLIIAAQFDSISNQDTARVEEKERGKKGSLPGSKSSKLRRV